MSNWKNRDIISIGDFTKEEILEVLEAARKMEEGAHSGLLREKVLATLFFEPSTRTRLSFEAAMTRLGGSVISFAEPGSTSVVKGESLSDSVRIVEGYCDVIVIRHFLDGSSRLTADLVNTPVINAGDGTNQHPTQTFMDLYTIQKTKGTLEGLSIGFLGDLKYGRTVHSLSSALAHFSTEMHFISPVSLQMPRHSMEDLRQRGVQCHEQENLGEISNRLDVIYCTRIQKERFVDPVEYEKVRGGYRLSRTVIEGLNVKKDLKILHPLPRVDEMDESLDTTEYAAYFQQAHNGIPVRKALLALVLGAEACH